MYFHSAEMGLSLAFNRTNVFVSNEIVNVKVQINHLEKSVKFHNDFQNYPSWGPSADPPADYHLSQ